MDQLVTSIFINKNQICHVLEVLLSTEEQYALLLSLAFKFQLFSWGIEHNIAQEIDMPHYGIQSVLIPSWEELGYWKVNDISVTCLYKYFTKY